MLFCIIHPEIVTSTPQKYISGETRDNGLQESFARSKIHYDPTKLRQFEKIWKKSKNIFQNIFSGRKILQRKSLIKSKVSRKIEIFKILEKSRFSLENQFY